MNWLKHLLFCWPRWYISGTTFDDYLGLTCHERRCVRCNYIYHRTE